jgi:hypothetical protein
MQWNTWPGTKSCTSVETWMLPLPSEAQLLAGLIPLNLLPMF